MSYKSIDPCLQKALEDEMLFVLMARDETAPEIVRTWAKANVGKQPKEKIQEALQCADEMEKTCADVNARKNTLEHKLKRYSMKPDASYETVHLNNNSEVLTITLDVLKDPRGVAGLKLDLILIPEALRTKWEGSELQRIAEPTGGKVVYVKYAL